MKKTISRKKVDDSRRYVSVNSSSCYSAGDTNLCNGRESGYGGQLYERGDG